MPEVKELLLEQKRVFEEFKKDNDARLGELETKDYSDPLLTEKVEKMNDALSKLDDEMKEIIKKAARFAGPGKDGLTAEQLEHKEAYSKFLRKGRDEGLVDLEKKALNVTTDSEGGYAVPEELDRDILRLMRDESPMRSVCKVITVGTADYKKLVQTGSAASGWVAETAARPQTNTPGFAQLTPYMGEVYANPAATQQMLDDAFYNVEAELAVDVATAFAEAEGTAFVSGDGSNKPRGILNYSSLATGDSVRAFGTLQHFETAAATAFTGDELLNLVYGLKKGMRGGAKWMMNGMTLKFVRKLKDSDNNYLWAPGLQAGQPSSLLGYGIAENEDMADIAAEAVPVMFGNFMRGYTIVDRMGTRVLRDPFTNKPYVHFYTTKRVGGMVVDSNAIKLLLMDDGA